MMRIMPFLRLIASSGISMKDFTEYFDAGVAAVGLGRKLYGDATSLSEITTRAKLVKTKLVEYIEAHS